MKIKHGPFIFLATVIVGCLVLGTVLAIWFTEETPPLLISVVLACAVASLLYGVLGEVTDSGFDFGPVKLGGSAAVLIGGAWIFNLLLEPQLDTLRDEKRQERASFNLADHVDPPQGWFAVDTSSGEPVTVAFKEPETEETAEQVAPPSSVNIALKLVNERENERFSVMGIELEDPKQNLGYVSHAKVLEAIGSGTAMTPVRVYGFKRLYLARAGTVLDSEKTSRWGRDGECLGTSLPFALQVEKLDHFADFRLTTCGSGPGQDPAYRSSLASGDAELVALDFGGHRRSFLVAVVAADHSGKAEQPWSTFLVVEMKEERQVTFS